MKSIAESLNIRMARDDDAEAITKLVNQAYRSKLINKGWTNESELVAGSRIDNNSVKLLIHKPQSVVLLAIIDEQLIACVHLLKTDDRVYLGMLSVNPEVQGMGIGKRMLELAEDYAWNNMAAVTIIMDVISQRAELISFYQRRGYQIHNQPEEYPIHLNVGRPLQDNLTVQQLVKSKLA